MRDDEYPCSEEPVHFHQSTCIKEKRPPGGGLQDSFPLSINNTVCSNIFSLEDVFQDPSVDIIILTSI